MFAFPLLTRMWTDSITMVQTETSWMQRKHGFSMHICKTKYIAVFWVCGIKKRVKDMRTDVSV